MGTFIIHFLPSFIIHCFPPSFASFLILLILLYYCYCLYLNQAGNLTHWLTAFERSLVDFSPLLSWNITTSFKNDLGLFKQVYFYLLDDTGPVINKLLKHQNDKDKARDLLNALIGPYKYLCIMCVTSDIFLWQRRPLDDDTLHRKFEVFFKTAKQIHTKLLKIWPDSEAGSAASHILYSSQFGFLDVHIRSMLETFEEYGLSRSAEPVLDLLWKISYPILPLIYPTCYNKDLKDWRIVLKNMPESNYKPKTEQITYDDNV